MKDVSSSDNQIRYVSNFQDFISTPFQGEINAICWTRKLEGDFYEIVQKIEPKESITVLEQEDLLKLDLSEQGQLAREIILNDLKLLKDHGTDPTLNLIKKYERDEDYPFFPTDVYSFHIDRSPITVDTFLCTYFGESSELLPNFQAEQKVLIPEIRAELKKKHNGTDKEFDLFLSENFFDLHYRAKPNAVPISFGQGNFWRLAVDCPESKVLPCIHRAPKEKNGQARLMMIC